MSSTELARALVAALAASGSDPATMPRKGCGRSAVTTTSGIPAWCASSTAGCRFATAVPEVVTTATARGDPRSAAALASPSA